jgi:hypothetical protein
MGQVKVKIKDIFLSQISSTHDVCLQNIFGTNLTTKENDNTKFAHYRSVQTYKSCRHNILLSDIHDTPCILIDFCCFSSCPILKVTTIIGRKTYFKIIIPVSSLNVHNVLLY